MDYELISAEEYDDLPDDNEDCFVACEAICRRNMNRMLSLNNGSGPDASRLREHYMATVSAVGIECGILKQPAAPYSIAEFSGFLLRMHGVVTRIRIRKRNLTYPYSVQLAPTTRTKIEHYISRIREIVGKSDLPAFRKKGLGSKLDELQIELENRRFGFGKTMAVLSAVLVGMAAATTIGAEGPAAVATIMKLIAADKETEEAARLRLAPPLKALPAPTSAAAPVMTARARRPSWDDPPKGGELDDEMPF
jgi:hypothetical protein